MRDRRRLWTGAAIGFVCLIIMFWWMDYFHTSGPHVPHSAAYFATFAWPTLAMFGLGYGTGGWKSGLWFAASVVFAICVVAGIDCAHRANGWC